ncbi:MAG: Fic family protein [Alphaproteobacteria bacterium]|nr:Fic family protein [Alphaproteobacteria bacterium]
MTDHKYGVANDPYCYPSSTVLKNKLNIRSQLKLDAAERQLTGIRFEEALPRGTFDVAHYGSIHRHLFQDIFAWAGEFREIRIDKDASMFCYPEFIAREMDSLFMRLKPDVIETTLPRQDFAKKASLFLADLNAIHPFREGNGRTQLAFLKLLSEQVGHPLNLKTFSPERLLAAMIASFRGDVAALEVEILGEQ